MKFIDCPAVLLQKLLFCINIFRKSGITMLWQEFTLHQNHHLIFRWTPQYMECVFFGHEKFVLLCCYSVLYKTLPVNGYK